MTVFNTFKKQVLAHPANDIVTVIGEVIKLTLVGSVYKGLSCFNEETDPSFCVWPESRRWVDYSGGGRSIGSGKRSGDVPQFLMEYHDISFIEAMKILADRAGIPWPSGSKEEEENTKEYRRLKDIIMMAVFYFHKYLIPDVREWVKKKYAFSNEVVEELQLGFDPGGLFELLTQNCQVTEEEALKTGLFYYDKSNDQYNDVLQGRVVFPYWHRGRVLYCAGRAHGPGIEPKYKKLASNKGFPYVSPLVVEPIYGVDTVRAGMPLIISEGPADITSAHIAGYAAIGPVTTTFKQEHHAELIKLARRASTVFIVNDNEENESGTKGAITTADVIHPAGADVRIVLLPRPSGVTKVDLCDYLKTHTVEEFQALLDNAPTYPEFLIDRMPTDAKGNDLTTELNPVFKAISTLDQFARDRYIESIADKLNADKQLVLDTYYEAASLVLKQGDPITIDTTGRWDRDIIADAWHEINKANHPPKLFTRDGYLVTIRYIKGEWVIREMKEKEASVMLRGFLQFMKMGKRGLKPCNLPDSVLQDLVVAPDDKGLPELKEIFKVPVFDTEGKLISKTGFNSADGVYLDLSGLDIPQVPDKPDEEQVKEAKALLEELICDFPFETAEDRTRTIGLILTLFLTMVIRGRTPLFLIEAAMERTGKTLLADIISLIATGKTGHISLGDSGEEIVKVITAMLIRGQTIAVLDNVESLSSRHIAAVITSEIWEGRILGKSEMVNVRNKSVWIATGNNVTLSTEMVPRTIRIRIVAPNDRPWTRTDFRHPDILDWVKANRGRLVHACLTAVQSWVAAGMPKSKMGLGGFESWLEVVGGVLEHLGYTGLLSGLEHLWDDNDTVGQEWMPFIILWWQTHRDTPLKVKALCKLAEKNDMLNSVRGDKSTDSQTTRMGRKLPRLVERWFGPYRIKREKDPRTRTSMYKLECSAATEDAAETAAAAVTDNEATAPRSGPRRTFGYLAKMKRFAAMKPEPTDSSDETDENTD